MTEFRENLAAYLDAVEGGETITITRRGRPSAQLGAAREETRAVALDELRAFRESLGVHAEDSVIVRARRGERY